MVNDVCRNCSSRVSRSQITAIQPQSTATCIRLITANGYDVPAADGYRIWLIMRIIISSISCRNHFEKSARGMRREDLIERRLFAIKAHRSRFDSRNINGRARERENGRSFRENARRRTCNFHQRLQSERTDTNRRESPHVYNHLLDWYASAGSTPYRVSKKIARHSRTRAICLSPPHTRCWVQIIYNFSFYFTHNTAGRLDWEAGWYRRTMVCTLSCLRRGPFYSRTICTPAAHTRAQFFRLFLWDYWKIRRILVEWTFSLY